MVKKKEILHEMKMNKGNSKEPPRFFEREELSKVKIVIKVIWDT